MMPFCDGYAPPEAQALLDAPVVLPPTTIEITPAPCHGLSESKLLG